MGASDKSFSELVPGTLGMLALKAPSAGEMHGYGAAEIIERYSDQVLRVEEGALYPELHRLDLRGLPTASGRKYLAQESAKWSRIAAAIERVMQMA